MFRVGIFEIIKKLSKIIERAKTESKFAVFSENLNHTQIHIKTKVKQICLGIVALCFLSVSIPLNFAIYIPIIKGKNQLKYFPTIGHDEIYGKIIGNIDIHTRNSAEKSIIFINNGNKIYSKIITLMNHHVSFIVGVPNISASPKQSIIPKKILSL